MRTFKSEELINDLMALKYQTIKKDTADRLTQQFHFDDFFAPQIEAWKNMSVSEQNEAIEKCEVTDDTTYAQFFNSLSRECKTARYSTFNVEMMNQLLKKYQPTVVVDPCMGWGHRMLMAITRGITYIGTDIRQEAVDANNELAKFARKYVDTAALKLTKQDGAEGINHLLNLGGTSMMFTCPPYFDSEIYGDEGIENGSYEEFLDWWKQIARNSHNKNIDYFAYQITPQYGDHMQKVTEEEGYELVEYIQNTRKKEETQHVNVKGRITKRNYGKIYVFKIKN